MYQFGHTKCCKLPGVFGSLKRKQILNPLTLPKFLKNPVKKKMTKKKLVELMVINERNDVI